MTRRHPLPLLVNKDGKAQKITRLSRVHKEFEESFLQELLAENPDLLPVEQIRSDVGQLMCIGREVVIGTSGAIDNLYISTGGYPIIVETKLWRNPQARREVLSQVLDYTKELVSKDFEWFEMVWKRFSKNGHFKIAPLIDSLQEYASEEIDGSSFVDRLNRSVKNGNILALIVGDGIETRLQKLVAHLCEDSAHLQYSLALIELAFYRLNSEQLINEFLVVPRIVREIVPVQRAYVRIEVDPAVEGRLSIQSLVPEKNGKKTTGYIRTNLSEEDFLNNLEASIGQSLKEKVETFYQGLASELGVEIDFKSATLTLKFPDPSGEKPGVSLLAVEQSGRIYNTKHMLGQLIRLGIPEETANSITSEYWRALNKIDNRFSVEGISHMSKRRFLPLPELIDNLDQIGDDIRNVTIKISKTAEGLM